MTVNLQLFYNSNNSNFRDIEPPLYRKIFSGHRWFIFFETSANFLYYGDELK